MIWASRTVTAAATEALGAATTAARRWRRRGRTRPPRPSRPGVSVPAGRLRVPALPDRLGQAPGQRGRRGGTRTGTRRIASGPTLHCWNRGESMLATTSWPAKASHHVGCAGKSTNSARCASAAPAMHRRNARFAAPRNACPAAPPLAVIATRQEAAATANGWPTNAAWACARRGRSRFWKPRLPSTCVWRLPAAGGHGGRVGGRGRRGRARAKARGWAAEQT